MAYKLDNFLGTISSTDRLIKIYDDSGLLVRTIDPFKVITTQAKNNVIILKTKTSSILLDFSNTTEARLALERLQSLIKSLTSNTSPLFVEKYLSNYVNLVGASGSVGPQGPTGIGGGTASLNLQTVTDIGSITSNSISIYNTGISSTDITPTYVTTQDFTNSKSVTIHSDGSIELSNGNVSSTFRNTNVTNSNVTLEFPDKINGSYTIATTDDIQSIRFTTGATAIYFDTGTISISGDIIPDSNDTYNIGNETNTWRSLHVSTISADSIILKSSGDIFRDGNSILYRYSGTSSTPLQLPNEGYVANVYTQDRLGFKQGQSLLVYNTIDNLYAVDDYVDDAGSYFVGEVAGYNFTTGLLEIIVSYSSGFGLTNNDGIVPTYSFWNIEISPSNYGSAVTITNASDEAIVTSDGANGLVAHSNFTFNNTTLSIEATTKFQQTIEVLNTSTASMGLSPSIIEYSFNLGSIWIHDDLSSDFQPDFQNVPETNMTVITSTIIIEQGVTAYLPTSPILINGSNYDIKWVGATPPSGNINQTDVVGFSFIRRNSDWLVLAQVSTFG